MTDVQQDQQLITVRRDGGIATVVMNRPPVNAIAPDLLEQFDAAINDLGADSSVRVIVVTSAIPRYFMAGADIKMMASRRPQGGEDAQRYSPFAIVERTPKPVIAAINGHALGGGCELALCCDYRLMLDDGRSTIGLTETSLGIIPGAGGTQRLPRLVGRARGLQMIFEGRRLTAPDALQIGLVDASLSPDDFETAVQAKARRTQPRDSPPSSRSAPPTSPANKALLVAWRPDHLLCGVTYLPAEVGPYLWHEFDVERTRRDLSRISAAGFRVVRVHLPWDVFVPTPRQVDRYRLRDLELFLGIAVENALQVVPVLFAQSFGDCVMLPRYAVSRSSANPRVRVISGGIIEPGGPRDVWDDPLMLEVESLWLDETLRAFANHPAILAWDLGHDPATTCRPVRTAHMEAWARLMGERVRATQDPCWLTLGAGDVLTARGVRLAAVAPHIDALGMVVHPQRLPVALASEPLDVARVLFVARLAQRLAAPEPDGAGVVVE